MQKNPSIRQTHFIGVLLPDELTRMLEECRCYMNRLYGCISGHATPVHITLVPPFALPREYTTADVVETLLRGIPKVELDARLSGDRHRTTEPAVKGDSKHGKKVSAKL